MTLGALLEKEKAVRWAELQMLAGRTKLWKRIRATLQAHKLTESCRNCTAEKGCCRQAVMVGLWEAVPIVARLRREGQDTPELRARLLAAGNLMDDEHRTGHCGLTFARYQPCVFLTNEKCSIYEVRPATCAGHAVASDPADCRGPELRDVVHVDTRALAAVVMMSLNGPFCSEIGLGTDHAYVTALPRAVGLLLEAWDREDFVAFLRNQRWIDIDTLQAAGEHANEKGPRTQPPLVQVRLTPPGDAR